MIEHGVNGTWPIDSSPDPGSGSNGFASVAPIPGGGLCAVGVTSGTGNNATLVAHHC